MTGDNIQPPRSQLGDRGVAVKRRRLDLRQLLRLHGPASDRFLTGFAANALRSGAAGATYVASHKPSASRYTEPSPFDALPCTRTLPFRPTLRLPVTFRAMVRMPPKPGVTHPKTGVTGSNPGSDTLQRQWTSTQRKTCSEHLSLYVGGLP